MPRQKKIPRRTFLKSALTAGATFYIVPAPRPRRARAIPRPARCSPAPSSAPAAWVWAGHVTENKEGEPPGHPRRFADVDSDHLASAHEEGPAAAAKPTPTGAPRARPAGYRHHPHRHAAALARPDGHRRGTGRLRHPFGEALHAHNPRGPRLRRHGPIATAAPSRSTPTSASGTFYRFGAAKLLRKLVDSGLLGRPLTVPRHPRPGLQLEDQGVERADPISPRSPCRPSLTTTCGSARPPRKPYHPHRVHGSFRGYWDYDGGGLTDMGQTLPRPRPVHPRQGPHRPPSRSPPWPPGRPTPDAVGLWESVTMKYADGDTIYLNSGEWGEPRPRRPVPSSKVPHGKVYDNYRTDPAGPLRPARRRAPTPIP